MTLPERTAVAAIAAVLATAACVPATSRSATSTRPPLRPAAECTDITTRSAAGEFLTATEGVTPPTPTDIMIPNARLHGELPRVGRLDLRFVVGANGRVERESMVATGFVGYPSRDALIREVSGIRFIPGSFEQCAVRIETRILFTVGPRQ